MIFYEDYELDEMLDEIYTESITSLAVGGVAAAATHKMNEATHEKVLTEFKESRKTVHDNIKTVITCIRKKDKAKAKQCISEASKVIDKCEKTVKEAEEDVLPLLIQHAAAGMRDWWIQVGAVSAALTATYSSRTSERDGSMGGEFNYVFSTAAVANEIRGTVMALQAIKTIYRMIKYNKDENGNTKITRLLDRQRADLLASLDNYRKFLKLLDKQIDKIK